MQHRAAQWLCGALVVLLVSIVLSGCTARSSLPQTTVSESVEDAARRLFPEVLSSAGDGLTLSPNATVGTPLGTAFDYRFPSPIPAEWVIAGGATAISSGMFDQMREAKRDPDRYVVPILDGEAVISEFELWRSDGHWEIGAITVGDAALGEKPNSCAARIEAARSALQASLGDGADVRVAVFAPSGVVAAVGRAGQNESAVVIGSAQGEGITGVGKFPDYDRVYTRQEFAAALR